MEPQHTPSTSAQANPRNMILKLDASERLCEQVGGVDNSRSVQYVDVAVFNVRANEMVTNIDVLRFPVRGVIRCQRKRSVVVRRDDER